MHKASMERAAATAATAPPLALRRLGGVVRSNVLFLILTLLMLVAPRIALAQTATPLPIAPAAIVISNEVFGLQGILRTAVGQPFGVFMIADANGAVYGLTGETAAVDQQIDQFNRERVTVRVWGTLFPNQPDSPVTQILVNSIVAVTAAVPTPAPTPITGASATVNVAAANVRSGPSTAYPVIGSLARGAACPGIGRNSDISWLQLACQTVTGWVSGDLLLTSGNPATLPIVTVGPPPVAPTPVPPTPVAPTPVPPTPVPPTPVPPTPTPLPPPSFSELPPGNDNWGAAYWSNMWLSGSPAFAQFENRDNYPLNRNWGTGAPAPGLPVDNFSARWRGNFQFASGDITFRARADDGVRVFLDGHQVINAWNDGPKDVSNTFRNVGQGMHLVVVEFYENTGNAFVQVNWSRASSGGGGGGGGGTGSGWRPDQ